MARLGWKPAISASSRLRYLLITPEIRRVDKEFEWMGRIKSFYFFPLFFRSTSFILLANIHSFILVSYYFANTRFRPRGWWLWNTSVKLRFFFFSSFFSFYVTTDYYYYRPIPILLINNGREKMGRKCLSAGVLLPFPVVECDFNPLPGVKRFTRNRGEVWLIRYRVNAGFEHWTRALMFNWTKCWIIDNDFDDKLIV